MTVLSVQPPFETFRDSDGRPLENGYIWIGLENLDPQTSPALIYSDPGMSIPVSQPIRTKGGYPVNGSAVFTVYVNDNYSIRVMNKNGATVYTAPSAQQRLNDSVVSSASNATTVTYQPPGIGAVVLTVQDALTSVVSVLDFIPKIEHAAIIAGTSTYNCTDDFAAASARINSQGGGKLIIPKGTYMVGKQDFAGAFGLSYAYRDRPIIKIENCQWPVIIESYGAKIKFVDGLKYGSFNPVTGAVYNPPGMPFTNADYTGRVGYMVKLYNNKSISLFGGLELDGNVNNVVVGGTYGDNGRQIEYYGIWAYNNDQCTIDNVFSHHHGADGIISGYDGLITEGGFARPFTLTNSVFENNGRQGWSIVGGRGVSAVNCKFNKTGRSIPFASAPGAGVDIEAEGGWNRDIVFINCEFSDNVGSGLVADSGDSAGVTFIRCRFIGTTSSSIWPKKPRMSFYDCLIVGTAFNAFSSATNPDDACKFFNCKFTDEAIYSPTGAVYDFGYLADFSTSDNVLFDTCTFVATTQRNISCSRAILRNCTFVCKAARGNRDFLALIRTSVVENLTILDQITSPAVDGYFIDITATTYTGVNFISGSGAIKWRTWSAGAGGAGGYLGQLNPNRRAEPYLSVIRGTGYELLGFFGTAETYWGPAVPIAANGTFKVGDRQFNSAPSVGAPKSWVCTAAGTPGTWVSEGNL